MKKYKTIIFYIALISIALYVIRNQHIIENLTNNFLYQEEMKLPPEKITKQKSLN
jgi:hypothetical protein